MGPPGARSAAASLYTAYCDVQLTHYLFNETIRERVFPTVLHELAHCFGFYCNGKHSSNLQDIMYRRVWDENKYSTSSIRSHINCRILGPALTTMKREIQGFHSVAENREKGTTNGPDKPHSESGATH